MDGTLRRPADLVAAGLIAPERRAEIARVAERYAVAITPDVAALIDPADAGRPDRPPIRARARELTTAPEERRRSDRRRGACRR